MDENMTWPRYLRIERYWEKVPPIGSMCATFVEKPHAGNPGEFGTMEDLARELSGTPGFQVRH